jgi:MinD-like ATPase involved in chromosome partitioning or flagellar assembly
MTNLYQPRHDNGFKWPTNAPPAAGRPSPAPQPSRPIATDFTARPDVPQWRQTPDLPNAQELGLKRTAAPGSESGWRKMWRRMGGGVLGKLDQTTEPRVSAPTRGGRPAYGARSIAVLSIKGGVGKTTTTVGLGATFAALHGDRVIAVDANPDLGTLAQRGPNETRSTVRDLLTDGILSYSDIRRHTSQSSSRLEILSSERDPAISEAFSESDYRAVYSVLDRFYNIVLTDCGTGLTHSAMRGVLDKADALVVVASPAIDSARSAAATLDWLGHHGYEHLVPNAIVVLSSTRRGTNTKIDPDRLSGFFESMARAVVVVPYDRHLAEGGEIVYESMTRKTRKAFARLAVHVADSLAHPDRRAD